MSFPKLLTKKLGGELYSWKNSKGMQHTISFDKKYELELKTTGGSYYNFTLRTNTSYLNIADTNPDLKEFNIFKVISNELYTNLVKLYTHEEEDSDVTYNSDEELIEILYKHIKDWILFITTSRRY